MISAAAKKLAHVWNLVTWAFYHGLAIIMVLNSGSPKTLHSETSLKREIRNQKNFSQAWKRVVMAENRFDITVPQ